MEGQEREAFDPCPEIRRFLHDLAQPLAAVTGLVELMLMQIDEHDALFQEVRMVAQQLQLILEIIEEIRRITREAGEAGSSGVETRPIPSRPIQ